jgi:hypothetical protein
MNMVRNGNARIMVVIDFKPMHNIGQTHCRGNPLWLPKIRAGTGACPYEDIELRIAKRQVTIPHFRNSPSALRNFSWWLPKTRAGTGACPYEIRSHEHGSQWQCQDNGRHRFQTHAQHRAIPL